MSRREFLAAAELVAGAVGGAGLSACASVDSAGIPRGGRVKKWKGELVGVKLDELQRTAERSRDHLVAQAKWPRTALGGYAPGH